MIESLLGKKWMPYAIALAAFALVVALATSFRGCSGERTERKRIVTVPLVAAVNLDAIKAHYEAQIAVKNATIENLREQIEWFSCEGELTRITRPDGATELRCVGKSVSEDRESDHSTSQTDTPILPLPVLPAVPPDINAPLGAKSWTWMIAGGAGFARGGLTYYVRGARRVWGPFGAEIIAEWPVGVLGGLAAAW